MVKTYPTGYVYKLYSHISELFYIGSTHSPMKVRMYLHRGSPKGKKLTEWFEDINFENVRYTILSEHKDITRSDLLKIENEEILKYLNKDVNCLNCRRAYALPAEYRIRNRDKSKQYWHLNKDKCKERNTTKCQCIYCGKMISYGNMALHHKTNQCKRAQEIYNFIVH